MEASQQQYEAVVRAGLQVLHEDRERVVGVVHSAAQLRCLRADLKRCNFGFSTSNVEKHYERHSIHWVLPKLQGASPEGVFLDDNAPFVITRVVIKDCHRGRAYWKSERKTERKRMLEEDREDGGWSSSPKKKKRKPYRSIKADCPAKMSVRTVMAYPEFAVGPEASKKVRSRAAVRLRAALASTAVVGEERFVVVISRAHCHHHPPPPSLDAALPLPVHPRIQEYIHTLTEQQNTVSPKALKPLVTRFSRETFGVALKGNRRFFPLLRDIQGVLESMVGTGHLREAPCRGFKTRVARNGERNGSGNKEVERYTLGFSEGLLFPFGLGVEPEDVLEDALRPRTVTGGSIRLIGVPECAKKSVRTFEGSVGSRTLPEKVIKSDGVLESAREPRRVSAGTIDSRVLPGSASAVTIDSRVLPGSGMNTKGGVDDSTAYRSVGWPGLVTAPTHVVTVRDAARMEVQGSPNLTCITDSTLPGMRVFAAIGTFTDVDAIARIGCNSDLDNDNVSDMGSVLDITAGAALRADVSSIGSLCSIEAVPNLEDVAGLEAAVSGVATGSCLDPVSDIHGSFSEMQNLADIYQSISDFRTVSDIEVVSDLQTISEFPADSVSGIGVESDLQVIDLEMNSDIKAIAKMQQQNEVEDISEMESVSVMNKQIDIQAISDMQTIANIIPQGTSGLHRDPFTLDTSSEFSQVEIMPEKDFIENTDIITSPQQAQTLLSERLELLSGLEEALRRVTSVHNPRVIHEALGGVRRILVLLEET